VGRSVDAQLYLPAWKVSDPSNIRPGRLRLATDDDRVHYREHHDPEEYATRDAERHASSAAGGRNGRVCGGWSHL
jgi:hypothetical protein